MHLLCRFGDDHLEWYVLSASPDPAPLQAEALALNQAQYQKDLAAWLESPKTAPEPMPLSDPRAQESVTFFVREVPDWPQRDSI